MTISTNTPSPANGWLSCPKPSPEAPLRLFCFPYAGGGASVFAQWTKLLPLAIEFYAVQLPGRETRWRETPYRQFPPLVETLTKALQPYLTKPFAFFGHSLGALICFEIARHLRRHKMAEPVHLIVSGRRPPHLPDPNTSLHALPDTAFIEQVQKRYSGIPQAILQDRELRELFLPLLRADFELLESYRYNPEPPFDYPVSAFGGRQDSQATEPELSCWHTQTHKVFSLAMFPGDHFFVQSARSMVIENLTQILRAYLT
jgi:medium-chain acyl-[acyl-carrier-protein] hydrolase